MSAMASNVLSKHILLCLQILAAIIFANGAIVNRNVERTVDVTSQLVKEYLEITAEDTNSFKEYVLSIPQTEHKQLSYISAKAGGKTELKYTERDVEGRHEFVFTLPSTVVSQKLSINLIYTNAIIAYPQEIKQNEKQLVKYDGNLYFYSPYKTTTQTTTVKVRTQNIISYSQQKPFNVGNNRIEYGPYKDIAPFSHENLSLHYESHTPFLTVNRLERNIEVSHWGGNIAIKENIQMTHTGALLKGPFSRYEFQKDSRSDQSAIRSYKTILPASATGVYYRDSNGNISTSNMKVMRDYVELELKPRFPLFGGWKTSYVLGYNVPSFEYLFNTGDQYLLKMRVIDHIYDDMVVEEAVVEVVLPEGSTDIQLIAPYPIKRHEDKLVYTYLDTIGRPVISFSKSNLVENHITDFQIKYKFSKIFLLHEPILVIAFIFVIFLFIIILLRLNFSISTTTATHAHKD